MNLIGRGKLEEFIKKHENVKNWINNWIAEVEDANWQTTQDIKNRYVAVSFLSNNVVIFNVKGNLYRLEVQLALSAKTVLVKWIGTHDEYTKRYKKGK